MTERERERERERMEVNCSTMRRQFVIKMKTLDFHITEMQERFFKAF
jgi:hypothetical protein